MDLGFDYFGSALTISPHKILKPLTASELMCKKFIQPTIFQVIQEKSRLQTFGRDV